MQPSLTGPGRKLLTWAMGNIFSAIIALCLLCQCAIGQNDLPPAFEIQTDTAAYTKLPDGFIQVMADPKGKYSFEQVRDSLTGSTFSYDKAASQLASAEKYWMRFVLKNTTDRQIKIWLGFDFRFNSFGSDIYLIRAGGNITHEVNGGFAPWSRLTGLKEHRFVPALIQAGESVIVYWSVRDFIISVPGQRFFNLVGFYNSDSVLEKVVSSSRAQYYLAINDVFIVGVLLFASVFIFFFFINIREKVYLYFAFYLISLAVGRLNTNWVMYDLFFREFPGVYFFIFFLIWFFPLFFLVFFVRNLLHVKEHFPKWDKLLLSSTYIYAGLYLVQLITVYSGGHILVTDLGSNLMEWALNFVIVLTFILCAERNRNNRVFLYVILPLQTLWSVLQSLSAVERFTGDPVWPWLSGNWLLIETVLLCLLVTGFCWMLLQRYGEMRKQLLQKDLEKEIEKNQLISRQNDLLELQVKERTAALSKSLEDLKQTQSQLIQSEKMASLGELTAGIAHEIQNPLNFVNNFSEVSGELILEAAGSRQEAGENSPVVTDLLKEVSENLVKINHHGKRADAIVKGMMQHSRNSSGEKEPTDINALAEEYLRLAYQGIRAKDKSFNAQIHTDFDPSLSAGEAGIGAVNLVPQDIGRVLLNLYNNAFWAVREKEREKEKEKEKEKSREEQKTETGIGRDDTCVVSPDKYQPQVSVTTRKKGNQVEITVKDNGNGIPQKVIDKIFQPFFTTKPAGQGTGLGLSLAYDIIKAHGGEIKVNSVEGEGSEFIIVLHVNT